MLVSTCDLNDPFFKEVLERSESQWNKQTQMLNMFYTLQTNLSHIITAMTRSVSCYMQTFLLQGPSNTQVGPQASISAIFFIKFCFINKNNWSPLVVHLKNLKNLDAQTNEIKYIVFDVEESQFFPLVIILSGFKLPGSTWDAWLEFERKKILKNLFLFKDLTPATFWLLSMPRCK